MISLAAVVLGTMIGVSVLRAQGISVLGRLRSQVDAGQPPEREVFEAFCDREISKGFFHGHTYSANPLACAAASAGIDLLCSDEIQGAIQRIHLRHKEFDKVIKSHPLVGQTRLLGVIYALDLNVKAERYGGLRDRLYRFFMDRGVFLRPLGNTIYLLPPFTITDEELSKIYRSVLDCLNALSHD